MLKLPPISVAPKSVALKGGLDTSTTPLFAAAGTGRMLYNYEPDVNGGYRRVGGIERFDGRPAPSAASYMALTVSAALAGTLALGDTITGNTSAATGRVIYIDAARLFLAVTRVTGNFALEVIKEGATPVGTVSNLLTPIDGFLDNELNALAATDYRADILRVPGAGRIRGVAALGSRVYAWRNNVGNTALAIYKDSGSGWTLVSLFYELSFTVGSVQPAEGATIAQGATSATIKRVVLESGSWSGGTAAGRYIITIPTGGVFAGGAFTTASMGTAPAAGPGVYLGSAITLAPDGVVRTHVYNFTASLDTLRLYGCDGVNREFEFDGTVLVPIVTGMGTVRATTVRCHKKHLMFGYRGSIQHSGVGFPYVWSPIFGAAELGTGGVVNDLLPLGGSEASAALMVICENALFVLYGNSTADWNLVPLSDIAGGKAFAAQDIFGAVTLDTQGVVRYPATQAFGNFRTDSVSQQIDSIARGQSCAASVFVADRLLYRIFFEDGTAITGKPVGPKNFEWTTVSLGRVVSCALHAEIAGNSRTFYGDTDGWVYEADKGRSFDGDVIQYAARLNEMSFGNVMMLKQFRGMELDANAESAFTLSVSAEFFDAEDEIDQATPVVLPLYGSGLLWDLSNYDEAYWDVPGVARKRFRLEGQGCAVAYVFAGQSDNELPHTLRVVTVPHTQRRLAR